MHPTHPGHYTSCAICCNLAASRQVTNSAIPSAEEEGVQVIEVPSDEEEVVEVPSDEEEVVEVPSNEEEMIEVPSAEEEVVEVPSDEEEMIEVPSAEEEVVEVPPNEEEMIEVPSAAAEEVKICCVCKIIGVEAGDFVTCATCTKVYIHRYCLGESNGSDCDSDSQELCWYCRDCDNSVPVSLSVQKTRSGREYKVKDDLLSPDIELGQTLICVAENKLHGLMAYRHKFGQDKVLSGARISCSLIICQESVVLIETLAELGAEVRCCSCVTSPICDPIASAIIARDTGSVFAWDGESFEEYWLCIEKCMDWGSEGGPHLIVDNGGDATLFVHEGVRAEDEYEKSGKLVDPDSARNAKSKMLLKILRARLLEDPKKYHKISKTIIGVSEESANGVNFLYQMQKEGKLLFSALNVADAVTSKRFYYGSGKPCLPKRLMGLLLFSVGHVTSHVAAGKVAVVCGYGDAGKHCTIALKKAGAHVMVTEIDPICALQAMMEGFEVVTLEDVLSKADIFMTATGTRDIVMISHMERMKHGAIVCNVGNNSDEIDMNGLQRFPGIRKSSVEISTSLIDCYVFPSNRSIFVLAEDQDRVFNLGWFSLTHHALAQSELWNQKMSGRYEKKVYALPKHLDEVVARLHLTDFNGKNGKLTELTQPQANYLGVAAEGPYKRNDYRY